MSVVELQELEEIKGLLAKGQLTGVLTYAEVATALAPQVFVSIHHNSAELPPSDVPGTETYFAVGSEDSERLGQWL